MPISTGARSGDRPTSARSSATMCTFVRRATPPVPGDTGSPVDSIVARMALIVGFESREATADRACCQDGGVEQSW